MIILSGSRCQGDINECLSNPCNSFGSLRCIQSANDYQCQCKPSFFGKQCQYQHKHNPDVDVNGNVNVNECECQNGGLCLRGKCFCQNNFYGEKCQFNTHSHSHPTSSHGCPSKCIQVKGDKKCDFECNTSECDYDGGDCMSHPYKGCPNGQHCFNAFHNGQCNPECNTKECLFDGFDCLNVTSQTCNELYDSFCISHYGDGQCDSGCNNAECGWDGLDCEREVRDEHELNGKLIITIDGQLSEFSQKNVIHSLVRDLTTKLNSVFKLHSTNSYDGQTTFTLTASNRRCQQQCFESVNQIAEFLSTESQLGITPFSAGFKLSNIKIDDSDEKQSNDDQPNSLLTFITLLLVIICVGGALLGVLVNQNKRKMAKGITWFPEGFFTSSHSGSHSSSRHRNGCVAAAAGGDFRRANGRANNKYNQSAMTRFRPEGQEIDLHNLNEHQNDDNLNEKIYDEPLECREWSSVHYEAYQSNDAVMTPPQLIHNEIDLIGPNGFTPLHLASMTSSINRTNDNPDSHQCDSSLILNDLLLNGASVDLTTDKTNETSLHLAARYARSDAAKRLLDSGADCNAQDCVGRTPLHTAIASDARGVFEILLRNRMTNLNARANDGSTPLILAARLACEGMLERLVSMECDINLTDDSGEYDVVVVVIRTFTITFKL